MMHLQGHEWCQAGNVTDPLTWDDLSCVCTGDVIRAQAREVEPALGVTKESFRLEKTSKIVESNLDPHLVTQPRALSATSRNSLDTSRDGDSTTIINLISRWIFKVDVFNLFFSTCSCLSLPLNGGVAAGFQCMRQCLPQQCLDSAVPGWMRWAGQTGSVQVQVLARLELWEQQPG